MGEVTAVTQLLLGSLAAEARLFTAVWLLAWTVGGGFAIYVFLWSLVGVERALLTPSRLAIKREVLGFGRENEYELTHVRNLRVAPSHYNPFDFRSGLQFWGIGGGTIAFDHGAATIRFGAALDESEAESIAEEIRSRAGIAPLAAQQGAAADTS